MAYWYGVAFGLGMTLFFIGLGTIPTDADKLSLLKWGGAVVALFGCIGAYKFRKRIGKATNS